MLGAVKVTKLGPLVIVIDVVYPSASWAVGRVYNRWAPVEVNWATGELEKTAFVFTLTSRFNGTGIVLKLSLKPRLTKYVPV